MLKRAIVTGVLLLAACSTAIAGPYVVYSPIVPVPVAVPYYAYSPVVAYYPAPVVAYTPGYYVGPGYYGYGRPAAIRSHVYYPGQPVRNALKVLAP